MKAEDKEVDKFGIYNILTIKEILTFLALGMMMDVYCSLSFVKFTE